MKAGKILILSYSHLKSDPRIIRQIDALLPEYEIETAAMGPVSNPEVTFHQLYSMPSFSLSRKLKRFAQLTGRHFEAYYWDDGKKNIAEALKKNHYDAIIANDIHTLPLALAISGNNRNMVYFDAHEYHPKEFDDHFLWRLRYRKYIEFLCKKYIPQAAAFSTVSENIAKEYQLYTGRLPVVVTNATAYYNIQPHKTDPANIKLIHHGAAVPGRQIENMIAIMNHLPEHYALYLMLTGKGTAYYDSLQKLAKKSNRIHFLDPVPFRDIVPTINRFDIGLYLLPPSNFNNLNALPNKFFEFIQARLAIVISPNPEMAGITKKYQLGMISEGYTSQQMAEAVQKMSAAEIMACKQHSHDAAAILSAEENIKKIQTIIHTIISHIP